MGAEAKRFSPRASERYRGDSLSPHAVARCASGGGERAQAALARRDRHDASGDPALAGQADIVEPLARLPRRARPWPARPRTRLQWLVWMARYR